MDGTRVPGAYYNEIDEYAAQWLRNLIRDGEIAPGDVDTRSIEDVCPDDLRGYTQCHFFAGVGAWSYALRRVGWSDDRPIWTGSCPCQPFSSAGKGDGFGDERHLWPAFAHLIAQCEPAAICGEQVADKGGRAWLDLVQTDMEGLGYAFWPVVVPIAGVGGPNERHRLWWVGLDDAERVRRVAGGHGNYGGHERQQFAAIGESGRMADAARWHASIHAGNGAGSGSAPSTGAASGPAGRGAVGGMADPQDSDGRRQLEPGGTGRRRSGFAGGGALGGVADAAGERRGETGRADHGNHGQTAIVPAHSGADAGGVDNAERAGLAGHPGHGPYGGQPAVGAGEGRPTPAAGLPAQLENGGWSGPLNGFWRNADWLFCTDGKWRAVEPGTRPLAYGLPLSMGKVGPGLARLCDMAGVDRDSLKRAKQYRVGTLKGYGNMISPEPAMAFIESWKDYAA